jgi:hypothetical protein
MNYTKILIKQDGAYALPDHDLTEKEKGELQLLLLLQADTTRWMIMEEFKRIAELSRKQALDNAVKFREDSFEKIKQLGVFDNTNFEGKLYLCPSGFEIVIENGYATLKNIK